MCDEVYRDRILRGTEPDGFYSMKKLGALGADLGAVACFFEGPWKRLDPGLSEADQAWLLNQAAYDLRALGRLTESLEPIRAGLEMRIKQRVWTSAAIIASNLSALELTLGELAAAVQDAKQSVEFADRSGDAFQRMGFRTTLADARHQSGRRAEALDLFREAEAMQVQRQPMYPLLYSLQGFRYCALLLGDAERMAWAMCLASSVAAAASSPTLEPPLDTLREVEQRTAKLFEWRVPQDPLLDIALDRLTLGRVALYRAILERSSFGPARGPLTAAVDGLHAGSMHHLPGGLLTRAWLRFKEGDPDGAKPDLDEACQIAERGAMKLHMADIHLHRARLFRDKSALADAAKLIKETGYHHHHRRDEELANARETLQRSAE